MCSDLNEERRALGLKRALLRR